MKPLSYSELVKYETDPLKWEQQYLLGIKEPGTFPQARGQFIHNMLFTGSRDGEKETYTPDQIRVHDKIFQTYGKIVEGTEGTPIAGYRHELLVEVLIAGVPTLAYWDGLKDNTLLELKTGATLWTEERARDHDQIAFYLLQAAEKDIDVTKILLASFSTTNGKGVCYELTPDFEAMMNMEARIKKAYSQMIQNGVWHKRISTICR